MNDNVLDNHTVRNSEVVVTRQQQSEGSSQSNEAAGQTAETNQN